MKALFTGIAILCLTACAVDARPGHGGSGVNAAVPNCPQGTSLAAFDGCLGAQSAGSSGVNANELTSYNAGTPFPTPTPWNVPARDYPVGYDTGLTLTPAASWTPAANLSCTTNGTTHQVSCNTTSATCASACAITGIDFTDWWILFNGNGSGGSSWQITNNKFKNGATIAVNNRQMVAVSSGTRINLDYNYNECDGNAANFPWSACLGSVSMGNSAIDTRTWNIKYNYIHDSPVRPFIINTTYAYVSINWNYAKTFTQDEWFASNVSVDPVLHTMTILGPFISTGANLVHGPDSGASGSQGSCVKYPSIPINTFSPTSVPGSIGTQISGTPGGIGVWNFPGSSTTETNAYIDCGNGLHGEVNASGQVTQTVQMLMSYRGNFITYGSDCPANGTSNIALLNTPNAYTTNIDTNIDYNTLVNGVSGQGEGCASQAIRNNGGPAAYTNTATISNNYLAPFNASAFGGSSTGSCFGNSGTFGFVGSQSGTTLTVPGATGASGKIPVGAYLTQSGVTYGYVTDNSAAASDGSGTYTMSDSRTQSFASGGILNAPLLTNAAGAIPYSPIMTGNKNMILSGSNADFVFSDAGMHTSAACHT